VCIARPRVWPQGNPRGVCAGADGHLWALPELRRRACSRGDAVRHRAEVGIVRRVRYGDALVPLRTEFAIEGAFFAVLLALAGVAVYAANRTVRVRRLSAQREAAERLTAVLDASTDGIISLDSARDHMVSSAVERMFGYSRATLLVGPSHAVRRAMAPAAADDSSVLRTLAGVTRAARRYGAMHRPLCRRPTGSRGRTRGTRIAQWRASVRAGIARRLGARTYRALPAWSASGTRADRYRSTSGGDDHRVDRCAGGRDRASALRDL